jgi:hypothetical protein
MAVITNYATLQTAIADTLAKSDLAGDIPNFIQYTENKLYRELNLRNEETQMSISVSSGTGTVPTDFKALKHAYVDESPRKMLTWLPIEQLYRKYPTRTGANTPLFISRDGVNFEFGPFPKDFTLSGVYYAKQDNLHTTDGSWYVQNAPELLFYGALLEASPFIKDDKRIPVWRELFNEAKRTVEVEQRNAERSKGLLYATG